MRCQGVLKRDFQERDAPIFIVFSGFLLVQSKSMCKIELIRKRYHPAIKLVKGERFARRSFFNTKHTKRNENNERIKIQFQNSFVYFDYFVFFVFKIR